MNPAFDRPKSLADPSERFARLNAIREPHVAPLNRLVLHLRRVRGDARSVPYFDPADGGTRARCLFLLEAPGAKAVESGFVSRNNPDETARNFFLLNCEAGIPRRLTVTWNVVPWYLGSGSRIRAATQGDIRQAEAYLDRVLAFLSRLEVVVLIGRPASVARPRIAQALPRVQLVEMPHPSPRVINTNRASRKRMLNVLLAVRHLLG